MSAKDLNEQTRKHYDELIPAMSGDYVEQRWGSGPVQRSHYRQTRVAIARAFETATGLGDVLEVGPGPGTWTDLCRAYSRSVTVCDISKEMLREARKHFGDAIEYVQGDFTEPTTEIDSMFDSVVSFRALEYMDDKSKFIQRAYDHLRPGGMLAVITKNPGWLDKKRGKGGPEIHQHWISWEDLQNLALSKGFNNVSVFPAAVGSYHWPWNNRLGAAACDLWHRLIVGKAMRGSWDALVESYLLTAEKTESGPGSVG